MGIIGKSALDFLDFFGIAQLSFFLPQLEFSSLDVIL
jgi:hypothetical protein